MSTFSFMELAFHHPQNRHHFVSSKEGINKPFLKSFRKTEIWRSMFLYRSNQPTEKDPMFGNFYLECDVEDFSTNQTIMLEVADYLRHEYQIPTTYLDFFFTNRSIWISIPAKVFGCFGSIKLNQIYKSMAEEIQSFLSQKGHSKGLDLSIYKWNGLIHSLGSFLKNSGRWVTKFSYGDLEEALTVDDLLRAEYDNFFTLDDIEVIDSANKWYLRTREKVVFSKQEEKDYSSYFKCERTCMKNLEEKGFMDENRNLHIYSYSLHLKELGYSTIDAIEKVQETFDIPYVHLRECYRTVKSAIEGTKRFNCAVVRQLLDADLFDCDNCSIVNKEHKSTFIIPREFIELLNVNKAHYNTYKYLLYILKEHQQNRKPYTHSLKGDKYKKLTISRFMKLDEMGLIKCNVEKDSITCKLVNKNREVYQSHIVIPYSFLEEKRFKKMNVEIKVLMELWRCSLLVGKAKKTLSFNVKMDTLMKTLKMSFGQLMKHISFLKKERLVLMNQLLVFYSKSDLKQKIHDMVTRIKNKLNKINKGNLQTETLISENGAEMDIPEIEILHNAKMKQSISIDISGLIMV